MIACRPGFALQPLRARSAGNTWLALATPRAVGASVARSTRLALLPRNTRRAGLALETLCACLARRT
jgi:hypothetical protein